jgi:LysR family transcriptional regulator, hydrogen peroxide-inducible genes activator
VALTEIGVEVARRAERILGASRDLVDFARHRRRILSGRLKLGIIPSLAIKARCSGAWGRGAAKAAR